MDIRKYNIKFMVINTKNKTKQNRKNLIPILYFFPSSVKLF